MEEDNFITQWVEQGRQGWNYLFSWDSLTDLTVWISSIFPEADYGQPTGFAAFFAPDGPFQTLLDMSLPYLYLADWVVPVDLLLFSLTVYATLRVLWLSHIVFHFITRGRV